MPFWDGRIVGETRMADKPTAPGTAEDARRRKRPTPTIDLTATEVKSTARQTPPPEEPPRAAEAAPDTGSAADSTIHTPVQDDQSIPKSGLYWRLTTSGVAGGAVVAVVLLALWFAGALPSRDNDTNALQARIALLETQLRNRP